MKITMDSFLFKVILHLSSIDEVENLLHEVVQEDCLAEAKAEVPDSIER